eukprot:gene48486-59377_t
MPPQAARLLPQHLLAAALLRHPLHAAVRPQAHLVAAPGAHALQGQAAQVCAKFRAVDQHTDLGVPQHRARVEVEGADEGVALVGLRLNPGTTLAESTRMGAAAEVALQGVPEVEHVGRRSGRAELDEHAEGVHVSELDAKLKRSDRSVEEIYADIRSKLAALPAAIGIGQPISHRIDHMLSGVRSQIAIKIFGDDLDTLRAQAEALRQRLAAVNGVVDLEVEKQVLTPQLKVQVAPRAALVQ